MVEGDLQQQFSIPRAKLDMFIEDLLTAGYLSAEHIPMVGDAYRVSSKGTRYLMRVGAI